MDLVLLTTDSLPQIGGVSDYLHGLLTGSLESINWRMYTTIQAQSHEKSKGPYPIIRLRDTRRLGERLGDQFSLIRKMNTLKWKLSQHYYAEKLIRRIKEETKPKYILIGRWSAQSHYWCRACRKNHVPYILFAYGLELVEPVPSAWKRKRLQDFEQAEKIISISRSTTDVLLSFSIDPAKISLVPPGIHVDKLEPYSKDHVQVTLKNLGLERKRFILCLGRLIKRKGFDLAIQAFSRIADEYGDVHLVIAGDGRDRAIVEAAANQSQACARIHLIGQVEHEQKKALFQQCEYYVMPNRPIPGDMEGFGIVFLEANILGKAVIGGNNGGVPDAVEDGVSGLLVDTDHTEMPLAEAMAKLLKEPHYTAKLAEAGRARALKYYDWRALANKFEKSIS